MRSKIRSRTAQRISIEDINFGAFEDTIGFPHRIKLAIGLPGLGYTVRAPLFPIDTPLLLYFPNRKKTGRLQYTVAAV